MNALKKNYLIALITLYLLESCGTFVGNPEHDKGDTDGSTNITIGEPEDVSTLNGPEYTVQTQNGAKILLTDAAVDEVSEVNIQISQLSLKNEDGKWVYLQLKEKHPINVLSLQDGVTKELTEGLEANSGTYSELRLVLDDTYQHHVIDREGQQHTLRIPSGTQSGIKIKASISIEEDTLKTFVLDFDLRQSLTVKGSANAGNNKDAKGKPFQLKQSYHLHPVIRLADKGASSAISAKITSQELQSTKTYFACLYKPQTYTTQENCDAAEATATVKQNGKFSFHYIPFGEYGIVVHGFSEVIKSTILVDDRKISGIEL